MTKLFRIFMAVLLTAFLVNCVPPGGKAGYEEEGVQQKNKKVRLIQENNNINTPIPRSAVRVRGEVLNIVTGEPPAGRAFRFMVLEVIGYGENFKSFMVRNGEVLEIRSSGNGSLDFSLNEEKVLDIITMPERIETLKYQQAVLLEIVR